MKFNKKDVRKIKNATQEELSKLQEEYEAVTKNIHTMSPAGLMAIAVFGILVIIYFRNNFFDFIGLVLLLYPLYVFVQRGGHRKGYFDGYYDMMAKMNSRVKDVNSEKSDKE